MVEMDRTSYNYSAGPANASANDWSDPVPDLGKNKAHNATTDASHAIARKNQKKPPVMSRIMPANGTANEATPSARTNFTPYARACQSSGQNRATRQFSAGREAAIRNCIIAADATRDAPVKLAPQIATGIKNTNINR